MEIRQLKYFIEIVNHKSFSKAASVLYITQPAITKAIKQLEDELGFRLIDRDCNYFRLTDQGEMFYRHSCDVYNRFQDLGSIAKDIGEGTYGDVIIGAVVLASTFFKTLISNFALYHPGVSIHIIEKTSPKILADVQSNICDLGFVFMPVGDLGNCQTSLICSEPMYSVIRKDNPLALKESICIEDLKEQRLALFNDDYEPHMNIVRQCKQRGFSPAVINGAPRVNLLLHMISLRDGMTFLPESYVAEYVATDHPELIAVPFSHKVTRDVAIIYNKNRYLSRAAREVLKFAEMYFSGAEGDFVRRKP